MLNIYDVSSERSMKPNYDIWNKIKKQAYYSLLFSNYLIPNNLINDQFFYFFSVSI